MKHIFTVGFAIAAIAIGWGLGKHIVTQLAGGSASAATAANGAGAMSSQQY